LIELAGWVFGAIKRLSSSPASLVQNLGFLEFGLPCSSHFEQGNIDRIKFAIVGGKEFYDCSQECGVALNLF
jgi:hypothetical protein